jgi:hypothetical protein
MSACRRSGRCADRCDRTAPAGRALELVAENRYLWSVQVVVAICSLVPIKGIAEKPLSWPLPRPELRKCGDRKIVDGPQLSVPVHSRNVLDAALGTLWN